MVKIAGGRAGGLDSKIDRPEARKQRVTFLPRMRVIAAPADCHSFSFTVAAGLYRIGLCFCPRTFSSVICTIGTPNATIFFTALPVGLTGPYAVVGRNKSQRNLTEPDTDVNIESLVLFVNPLVGQVHWAPYDRHVVCISLLAQR